MMGIYLLLLTSIAAWAQATLPNVDCIECENQSPVIENAACQSLNFEVQKTIYLDSIVVNAKGNKPEDALRASNSLSDLSTLAFQCGVITSCDGLGVSNISQLAHGWSEKIETSAFMFQDQGKPSCRFNTEIHVEHGNTQIRGIISRSTGKLSYHLPHYSCAPAEFDITRRISASEGGILMVDFSMNVKSFPGQWMLFKKKRTPQIDIGDNGNVRVVMPGDHYFEVSPSQGVIGSDLFLPEMFDANLCRSSMRENNTRSYTDIKFSSGSSSRFGGRFTDFGGTATERAINSYLRNIPRQAL